MQIIINEDEIIQAIKNFIGSEVFAARKMKVTLNIDEGTAGTTACVEILQSDEVATKPVNAKPVKAKSVTTKQSANTMQEDFVLKSKGDVVTNTALKQVKSIFETEAFAPDPEPEPESAPLIEDPGHPEPVGQDDVDSLFKV